MSLISVFIHFIYKILVVFVVPYTGHTQFRFQGVWFEVVFVIVSNNCQCNTYYPFAFFFAFFLERSLLCRLHKSRTSCLVGVDDHLWKYIKMKKSPITRRKFATPFGITVVVVVLHAFLSLYIILSFIEAFCDFPAKLIEPMDSINDFSDRRPYGSLQFRSFRAERILVKTVRILKKYVFCLLF